MLDWLVQPKPRWLGGNGWLLDGPEEVLQGKYRLINELVHRVTAHWLTNQDLLFGTILRNLIEYWIVLNLTWMKTRYMLHKGPRSHVIFTTQQLSNLFYGVFVYWKFFGKMFHQLNTSTSQLCFYSCQQLNITLPCIRSIHIQKSVALYFTVRACVGNLQCTYLRK